MSRIPILALVALVSMCGVAIAMDNPGPGWEQVSESPEIWKDPTVEPAVYYNAEKFVVDPQEDGTYKVAEQQPMTFATEGPTGEAGEGIATGMTPEGKTKFTIQEDNDQCKITEHSVSYNDTATANTTGAQEPPEREVKWVVTDQQGNEVARQEGTDTSYCPQFSKPGVFNLGNGGVSEVPPSETMEAGGTVTTGQDAELEVVDVTAPTGSFAFVPEDYHEINEVKIDKTIDTDKYPMLDKKADLSVSGKNFDPGAVSDWQSAKADSVISPVSIPYGNPYVPEKWQGEVTTADVGNGELEVKLRSNNTVDLTTPLHLPIHVRTKFVIGETQDNGSTGAPVNCTWKLTINREGTEQILEEPPHYEFPVATHNSDGAITGAPTYTFTYDMRDVAGNITTVNVPINVLDIGVDIKDIETRSGRQ